jgi:hypothetical protein
LQSPKEIEKFKKSTDENVRTLMELMKLPWIDIMLMPYQFFIDTLKWKIDLEDEKRKKLEERSKSALKTKNVPPGRRQQKNR